MAKAATLSRDLTTHITGSVQIRIHGVGIQTINDLQEGSLATYVARAYTLLTGKTITIADPQNSPFEILAFDERMRSLLVQLIPQE